MKIERAWWSAAQIFWVESEDRAKRELANAHGADAVKKLKEKKKISTQYAYYRVVE